jgi:cytochrome c-type biogenesis protein CcmH/NrfG
MSRDVRLVAAVVIVVAAIFGAAAWLTQPSPLPVAPQLGGAADIERLRSRTNANVNDVAAWKELGHATMAAGRYQEAIEAWSMVSRLRPDDRDLPAALATLRGIAERGGRHPTPGRQ